MGSIMIMNSVYLCRSSRNVCVGKIFDSSKLLGEGTVSITNMGM